MFLDRRLDQNGEIPTAANIRKDYYISNERRLHLRLTSPHEVGETPKQYMDKAKRKMASGRWTFACPFQPDAYKKMPDVVISVKKFIAYFNPERVRVVFLSPNRHGLEVNQFLPPRDLSDELLQVPGVEVACIDARRRVGNGLLLADFFDFT